MTGIKLQVPCFRPSRRVPPLQVEEIITLVRIESSRICPWQIVAAILGASLLRHLPEASNAKPWQTLANAICNGSLSNRLALTCHAICPERRWRKGPRLALLPDWQRSPTGSAPQKFQDLLLQQLAALPKFRPDYCLRCRCWPASAQERRGALTSPSFWRWWKPTTVSWRRPPQRTTASCWRRPQRTNVRCWSA